MKILIFISLIFATFRAAGQKRPHSKTESHRADTVKSWNYIQSGEAKYGAEKYAEALADFTLAITYNRRSALAYRLKGDVQHQLELYDSAIVSYSKAIALNIHDALAYRGRADSHRCLEDCEPAINDYNSALIIAPDDGVSNFELRTRLL